MGETKKNFAVPPNSEIWGGGMARNTLFLGTKQLNIHRVRKKNGTNNVLGITLTKFNKFSQFLAQFMLTYQLTKKL